MNKRFRVHQSLSRLLTILAMIFSASMILKAQISGVDLSFNTVPANGTTALGDFEIQPDGKILTFSFGGTKIFNGVPKNRIARLNSDGTLDNSFDCAACDFNIYSVRLQPDGKIIVGGNSSSVARISRLNADGSIDGSFAAPFGGVVRLIQPDGKILISIYTVTGFNSFYSLVRLNADGSQDNSFTTINFGASRFAPEFITQVRLQADGKILVTSAVNGSLTRGALNRYNSNGTRDTTFESPTFDPDSSSFTLTDFDIQPDGGIVIVGKFSSVNSVSRSNIARILPAGNLDLTFAQTNLVTAFEYLTRIKILADGKFLVSSAPAVFPGYPPPPSNSVSRLLRLNADGTLDNTFSAPNNFLEITKWVVDAQGRILVTYAVSENGAIVYRTQRLNPNGSPDSTFSVTAALVGSISVLASQSDGKAIIGGNFDLINNVPRNRLARVNADGSLDAAFNPGTGFDVAPKKIVVQADGKVLAGGSFTNYNGTAREGIARLNADGSLDGGFAPVISSGFIVNAIAVRGDGKIHIGGTFSTVNGQTRSGIALLNADGTLDATFNATIGNADIRAVTIQSDGKILVGGSFSGVSGFNRSNLVRLNADGTLDNSFNAGSIQPVNQIEAQADGRYVALTATLIRLTNTGATDATFQSPTFSATQSAAVNAFVLQPDGSVIIGGSFTAVNASPRSGIARLKADGTLDLLFLPNGANGSVNALVRTTDGKILVGGNFMSIGGVSRLAIARLTVTSVAGVTPFDFNGDGRSDVSVFRPSSGTWYTSTNPAINYGAIQFGIASDKLVPADYDGDGKTDVAVFRDGRWFLLRSQAGFTDISFGLSSDVPVPADYDGDGRADVAVFRPSNATWYLLRSTLGFTSVELGLATDKPVPADYDGDGRAEPAVFRPSNGFWYNSTNPATNYGGVQFGAADDKPVPADYDGDGKIDRAVFRPANGTWYLLQSTAGFTGIAFGISSDLPTAADYDGDGKADVAVFRNGIWYLNRSTQGFTSIQFGVSDDKPVPNSFVR